MTRFQTTMSRQICRLTKSVLRPNPLLCPLPQLHRLQLKKFEPQSALTVGLKLLIDLGSLLTRKRPVISECQER
jgi:hypothetical protein